MGDGHKQRRLDPDEFRMNWVGKGVSVLIKSSRSNFSICRIISLLASFTELWRSPENNAQLGHPRLRGQRFCILLNFINCYFIPFIASRLEIASRFKWTLIFVWHLFANDLRTFYSSVIMVVLRISWSLLKPIIMRVKHKKILCRFHASVITYETKLLIHLLRSLYQTVRLISGGFMHLLAYVYALIEGDPLFHVCKRTE